MDIDSIFSTPKREKILRNIIYQKGPISVTKVAKDSRISKGLASKYLDLLVSQRVLTQRKRKFYPRNNNNSRALKLLITLDELDERLFNRYPFVESAGLYGSASKGENDEDSDIDLWIRVRGDKREEIALLTTRISRRFPKVNLLFLDDKKIARLRTEDPLFYHSLYFGSIIIYGEKGI
jgi:predicted nucleotidyltransferase